MGPPGWTDTSNYFIIFFNLFLHPIAVPKSLERHKQLFNYFIQFFPALLASQRSPRRSGWTVGQQQLFYPFVLFSSCLPLPPIGFPWVLLGGQTPAIIFLVFSIYFSYIISDHP